MGPNEREIDASSSRRSLLAVTGIGLGASLLAACGAKEEPKKEVREGPGQTNNAQRFSRGDTGIAEYALLLELLELDFYDKASGSGVLKGSNLELLDEIGQNEAEHVDVLKKTVEQFGGRIPALPETTFSFPSERVTLETAATLENTGAAAYLGQAPRVQDPDFLAAALSIHTVEARHAAAINELVDKPVAPDGPFAKPMDMDEVLKAIKPFLEA